MSDVNGPPGPSTNMKGPNNIDNAENMNGPNNNGNAENISNPPDINMFKEICGVDDETALRLLRESGGNLEAAIHQFFYTRDNPEVLQNQDNEAQELRRRHLVGNNTQPNAVGPIANLPVVPQPQLTWSQWIGGLVILPFRFFYSTAMDLLLFLHNFLFGPTNGRPRPILRQNQHAIRAQQGQQQQQNVIEDRMLMREQQTAYEQALAIDKQKAEKRKKEEEQRQEAERLAREEEERMKNKKARLAEKRREVQESMQPEPEAGEENLVRIRIAFPNGGKVERKFSQADSLERLFEFVFIHPDCPDDFSLLTNYPSILLHCTPKWYRQEFPSNDETNESDGPVQTFAEAGLLKSAIVMIRDNEA